MTKLAQLLSTFLFLVMALTSCVNCQASRHFQIAGSGGQRAGKLIFVGHLPVGRKGAAGSLGGGASWQPGSPTHYHVIGGAHFPIGGRGGQGNVNGGLTLGSGSKPNYNVGAGFRVPIGRQGGQATGGASYSPGSGPSFNVGVLIPFRR